MSENWGWGFLAGGLVSFYLVRTVKAQPFSRRSGNLELFADLTWAGLVYGLIDALFLNVMPVVAVWLGTSHLGWAATPTGSVGVGAAGLLASLFVTLTYHLGYPEFRTKLDIGLDALSADAEEIWQRRLAILDELREFRARQPFEYSGDLVNEAREEHEREMGRIWRGE